MTMGLRGSSHNIVQNIRGDMCVCVCKNSHTNTETHIAQVGELLAKTSDTSAMNNTV